MEELDSVLKGLRGSRRETVQWSRYDVLMLLAFQAAIACVGGSLLVGQFQAAFMILLAFAFALALVAFFARGV
jgi:hypothetical protein